jgi:hypothetical protein
MGSYAKSPCFSRQYLYVDLVVIRKIIAAFMVLVIANPACCCAFKEHANGNSSQQSSCCSSSKESKKTPADTDCPCSCASAKQKAEPKQPAILHDASPARTALPYDGTWEFAALVTEPAAILITKWPPGKIPAQTTAARLAAKCSYLI